MIEKGVDLIMRSNEFVGIAEGIKSLELSTKDKIEKCKGKISELSETKQSLYNQISYLKANLEAAYAYTDEDGGRNYSRIAAIESQINYAESKLSEVETQLDIVNGELFQSQAELKNIIEDKTRTLSEIQERAKKTSQNIAFAGGMYGAYAGVGSTLQGSMQTSLASLSKAASILDGSVEDFSGTRSKGQGLTDVGSSSSQGGLRELSTSALSAFSINNNHNYGISDYPEYSQDLEWQKLHNTAYPSETEAEQNSKDDEQIADTQDATTNETSADETKDTVPDASADTQENLSEDNSNSHKESWNYDECGPNPFTDDKALARGEVADHVFNDKDVDDINRANLKLEDLSKNDYENLKQKNPQKASQLLTDYNDRNIMPDDLSSLPRHLDVENNNGLYVVDKDLSVDKVTMRDVSTGQEYSVYPNPMDRVSHMAGQQGQNDLGMHQDCGIASTAKGINDVYGKNVTSENRLANYAYDTHNCSIKNNPDGTVNIYNSGGTWEGNIKDFYNANGLSADMYVKDNVPSPDYIASRLKNGDVATLAVNNALMWYWDKAKAFNPANVDTNRYATDPYYARYVNDLMKMQNGGVFKANHFVNVSNAVYDKNGTLTHFIVSDTGNGTTRMIEKDYLYRAYNGDDKISVSAQGCVIAGRRQS